jgi:catalase
VNAPRCPVQHYHKDGAMRFFANLPSPNAYYEPNSFQGPDTAGGDEGNCPLWDGPIIDATFPLV